MTIRKKASGAKEKGRGSSKEVATTSSTSDMTVETVEVVSSTSVVEEARQIVESESRSSVVEVTSASREVIMDSKGNVIKVIESPPQILGQSMSNYKTGKSSQDFIAQEQTQLIKQGKTASDRPRSTKEIEVRSDVRATGEASNLTESHSESRAETIQKSVSSTTMVETLSSTDNQVSTKLKTTVSNGAPNGDHAPRAETSSRSFESRLTSQETYEASTKDGQTVSSTTRIRETGEKVDDNGRVTASQSRNVDSETSVVPSDLGRVKHTDDVRASTSSKVILDSSAIASSESTKSDSVGEIVTRCNRPGQSTWDGTFVSESSAKERNIARKVEAPQGDRDSLGKAKVDRLVFKGTGQGSESSVEVSEQTVVDQRVSSSTSTVIRDTTVIVDEGRTSSTNIESFDRSLTSLTRDSRDSREDTVDFSGGPKQTTETHLSPSRYTKPGESTWDGTFVTERTPEPRRRNVSDASVFRHPGAENVIESTQRSDFREKSTDGSYEKKSSNVVHVVQGGTDSSRFISEERRDVTEETYIDGKRIDMDAPKGRASPTRRATKPGDSAWNGQFVYEKPKDSAKKPSTDKTVVRTSQKRHDSVDVQDVTEEQNVSSVSESVSTSYVIEYAAASDEKVKNVEKVTAVSETIHEEDTGDAGSPRRPGSPEKTPKRDSTPRSYKPGQSTWDGSFVHEKPQVPERRKKPDRRPTDSVVIRDVTEDNSINEAEISTASYIVEHSSSQQSFTDIKDSSLSSVHEIVHPARQDGGSSRPGSPEKTPKGRDVRVTKPGSSTWDGTFVRETPERRPETRPETRPERRPASRPPSRESVHEKPTDKAQPDIGKSPVPTSRRHVSDTTLDIQDTEVSSTSEVFSNSVVMEQSMTHESYTDSSNLDFSTSSVETVIIRDGVPTTTHKTVTIEERTEKKPHQPEDDSESPDKRPDKRPESPDKTDRSSRPSKPGASTWDGSFVYEKQVEMPGGRKTPIDLKQSPMQTSPMDAKKAPEEKKPTYFTEKIINLTDTSKDVHISDFVTSTTLERTLDSKSLDNSNIFSTTVIHQVDDRRPGKEPREETPRLPSRRRPEDDGASPDSTSKSPDSTFKSPDSRSKSPERSPVDRSTRPTKPGASTWDGSFVYEKLQDQRKKPTDEEKKPAGQKKPIDQKKPTDQEKTPKDKPKDDKPVSPVPKDDTTKISIVTHDVKDLRDVKETIDTEVLQRSYVIDQSSSFSSVQDVREVVEERVISEFTTDTRKDSVS